MARRAERWLTLQLATTAASLALAPWRVATAGSPLPAEPAGRSGAELYRMACASCHGATGTGAPQALLGFATPLPDFTDCSFATREADFDWGAVVHDGGPTRGFAAMMPAFGDALTPEESARVLDHIRSFCTSEGWPRGELNLPRALVTEKAFPEDEVVLTTGVDVDGRTSIASKLIYEKRLGPNGQIEIIVPFSFSESEARPGERTRWRGGIGDLALGYKHALAHSLATGTIFSAAAELILPTGDARRGFGKDTAVFEPFVALGQVLPADSFVQVQAGVELPFDESKAEQEGFARAAIGTSFTQGRFGRTWSPMVEVLAASELGGALDIGWELVPQVQVTLNTRQHVMMSVGARMPLGGGEQRPTQVMAYLLWDWFDGGFTEGW